MTDIITTIESPSIIEISGGRTSNIEVSGTGPRGPRGYQGESGVSTFLLSTNSDIGGNRAIGIEDGYAVYASLSLAAVGISTGAVAAGEDLTVQSSGKMSISSANFTANALIFVNDNGTLTQEEPTIGNSQVLGSAIDSENILINVNRVIQRS